MYFNYQQDDWNTWLPLEELAYNNSDHSSAKQSPFFTVYGRDPHFESGHITQDTSSRKLSTKIQSVQQEVRRELEVSINRFKRYADKSRAIPPVFNPGDIVWLSSKNIKSTRPTKKLSERWLGPFPILKKVSTYAYHLKLASQWKSIHPVFHISLLDQSRHQESQIGIKSLLLQSSFKKKRNGKSLKYWTQSLGEENYGIWWNGKVSVKNQKDPLGNQLKTSRIVLNCLNRLHLVLVLRSSPFQGGGNCHNHGNPPSWTSLWHIPSISNIWQFGHIHNRWPNWPLSFLMALMVILSSGASLAPSPSSSHSRLSPCFWESWVFSIQQVKYTPKACIWIFKLQK
ncbi:hypothetical protein O181_090402 [Austropuccinia psidii MF-1]|uniref:Tf2-1-like SH3-like domain-containing protein n=1 Tax=Austropuccinia psidii MF-1 TaxID=1389203 RepID=A0A9Q3P7N0_9BASI|nr:hypothetical protein [Austropuccinia psidii MF-1]